MAFPSNQGRNMLGAANELLPMVPSHEKVDPSSMPY